MRTPDPIATALLLSALLLLAPAGAAAAGHACGDHDLTFGCTGTGEKERLRVGCAVRDGNRYFASEWRLYDLQTEEVLARVPASPEGVALIDLPARRWVVVEGELVCTMAEGEMAIPYRFLLERTGEHGFRQRPYTAESLDATGNWNADTQLQYGAFRSRSMLGLAADAARP